MMKTSRLTLIALLALGLGAATPGANAQDKPAEKKPGLRARGERPGADRLKQLSTALNLSDAQKEKLAPILKEERQKLSPIAKDDTLSREQKMEKAKPIREEYAKKIEVILTDEQKARFKELRDKRPKGPKAK